MCHLELILTILYETINHPSTCFYLNHTADKGLKEAKTKVVSWFYSVITLVGLFYVEVNLTVIVSNYIHYKNLHNHFKLHTCCNINVLRFSVLMQFKITLNIISIFSIDWALTSTISPSQSGPRSKCNEGMTLHFPDAQNINFTTECSWVSYPEHSSFLGGSYSSAVDAIIIFWALSTEWLSEVMKTLV